MATAKGKKDAPTEKKESLTTGGEEKAKRKVGTRGSTKFPGSHIITLLVDYNPKRAGSASHGRFEKYEDEMTVEDAQKAGITAGDLLWDTKHGFIEIGEKYNDKAVVKSKPEPKPKKEKAEKAEKPSKAKTSKKAVDEDEEEEDDE